MDKPTNLTGFDTPIDQIGITASRKHTRLQFPRAATDIREFRD
jgi:hypothetical protein